MPGPASSVGPDGFTPDSARQSVSFALINNYVLYSSACMLVYELFTSLDDEVERVWSLKWRLPKILFMLNRYVIRALMVCLWIIADFPGTSAEFCRIYSYWQMIPLRLAILTAQALVVIRVWAIYNNSRRMFWVLTTLYTLEVAAVTLCVVVATADTQGVAQPAPLSCALNPISGNYLQAYASGTWIAPACFEFIMIVITLAKILPRWTWGGRAGLMGSGGNPTLDILARDSLIYFGLIFTFTLTSTILYELGFYTHYHTILLGPTSAISCIAVSRMMINIRSLPSSPLEQPTTTTGAYARADLSFADYASEDYGGGGIPDTARTAYFDHAQIVHASDKGYFGLPPGGYAIVQGAYGSMARPSSARTSGDATRVGDTPSESGSMIEMGLRKKVLVV